MLMNPPNPPKPSITNDKADGEHHRLVPRQRADPAQEPTAAADAPGDFQARAYREDGQQGRQRRPENVRKALQEFKARADARGQRTDGASRPGQAKTRSMMKVSRPIVSL